MGAAMLCKSLIQVSVDGWGCIPSLLFDLRPNYGGGNEDDGGLLEKILCRNCPAQCPWPCSRPQLSHASARDSCTLTGKTGSVSCGVPAPFSWIGVHKVLFVPSKSLFPQSCVKFCKACVRPNPTGLQSQILWEFSVPLPDPQVGKAVVGPRTFLTVREFLWYNCSAVCGSSTQQLYGGVNGDLLQERGLMP